MSSMTKPLARGQETSPVTRPLIYSTVNKIGATEGHTINFDLRLADCCFSSHAEEEER